MRKLTALAFVALFTATAAFASPNDSTDRHQPGTIARIIRMIRQIIDDPSEQPVTPIPAEQPVTPTPSKLPGTPTPTSMWH